MINIMMATSSQTYILSCGAHHPTLVLCFFLYLMPHSFFFFRIWFHLTHLNIWFHSLNFDILPKLFRPDMTIGLLTRAKLDVNSRHEP